MMKRIFITGAARRLGREIAAHLAKPDREIIVHYNHSESDAFALQKEIGCKSFQADFSKTSVDELRRRLDDEVGPVEILINNASSFQKANWPEINEDLWDHEHTVNLK